jgi:hypothetical protein
MADIGDFTQQLASFYSISQSLPSPGSIRKPLKVSPETVEKFVRDAYYASLIPDEGRWPSSTLICYPPEVDLQFHLLFDEPRTVSSTEISKLSHALDNRSHIACTVSDGEILLAGFHVNRLASRRELGFGTGVRWNTLEITIKGPGHLEATADLVTLIYRGGEILQNSPLTRSRTMERLLVRLRDELHDDDFDPRMDSLSDVVNELMRAILRLGHGGMVIFADTPKMTQFSSFRQSHCHFLHELLFDYWMRIAELIAAAGGIEKWIAKPDASGLSKQQVNVAAATDRLENCVQAIANLSGMDGAIVLTYGCNVGAFNAIINRQNAPEIEPKLIDVQGREIDQKDAFARRGSRHQSGLLYARTVSGCFVFVISQDGSISAFHNPSDGTVICEFGLRPME